MSYVLSLPGAGGQASSMALELVWGTGLVGGGFVYTSLVLVTGAGN